MTSLLRKTSLAAALAALSACLWLNSSIVHAEIVTVPSGLSPGDMYRLVFVTSGVRDATSTDIEDYNAFVRDAANAVPALAALDTQWLVIGSTATVDARNNTGTLGSGGVPIFLLDGTRFADSNDDLWDGDLAVPLDLTELDTVLNPITRVFTGTAHFGGADPGLTLGEANVTWGRAGSTGFGWVRANNSPATDVLNLYAMSAPLSVPEPADEVLIANGLTNVIDTNIRDNVVVRDLGCPDASEPSRGVCTSPVAPTTVELVDGGAVDDIEVFDSSTFTMEGGTVGNTVFSAGSSTVTISAGTTLFVQAAGSSTVTISGGTVESGIQTDESATLTIRGGAIEPDVGVFASSTLTLIGTGFTLDGVPAAFGGNLCPGAAGKTLAGLLASGDPIEVLVSPCSVTGRMTLLPPLAPEFQVNTYTTGGQRHPSVAADSDGDFVVVWRSNGSSGSDSDSSSVQGQRYASDGTLLGGEFQVNTYTTDLQRDASVAADADGDFVVVWQSNGSSGSDSDFYSVQGQRYASDGTALGGEFQVNTYTTGAQRRPSVAAQADGDFVMVWDSAGSSGSDSSYSSIQGQRYASDGTKRDGEFQVNTYTTDRQYSPSVAADADGDFVVVWQSNGSSGSDSSSNSVQGQRYASDGTPLGGEFQVNTYTTETQRLGSVAVDADGDFVVVWTSYGSSGSDSSGSVRGQRYASDGTPLGGEFQVNTYTTGNQFVPSAAAQADGDFVVVWESDGSFGSDSSPESVQAQRYASDGTKLGGEFQVNSYTTDEQHTPSVAAQADGDFVVVWDSDGSFGSDSDSQSIQGRRFTVPEPNPHGSFGVVLLMLAAMGRRVARTARLPH